LVTRLPKLTGLAAHWSPCMTYSVTRLLELTGLAAHALMHVTYSIAKLPKLTGLAPVKLIHASNYPTLRKVSRFDISCSVGCLTPYLVNCNVEITIKKLLIVWKSQRIIFQLGSMLLNHLQLIWTS
jgi:hypothetical protein